MEQGGTGWNREEQGGTGWNREEQGGTGWNKVDNGVTSLVECWYLGYIVIISSSASVNECYVFL